MVKLEKIKIGMKLRATKKDFNAFNWPNFLKQFPKGIAPVVEIIFKGEFSPRKETLIALGHSKTVAWWFSPSELEYTTDINNQLSLFGE